MASETPSTQEGLSQHPFVEKLMPDPAQPAPSTVQFEGLVGKSTRGGDHWRLYLDRELSDYIEFSDDDVLNSESITKEQSPIGLETTKVWLRRDALITRAHSRQVQANTAANEAFGGYVTPSAPGVVPAPIGDGYDSRNLLGAFPQSDVMPQQSLAFPQRDLMPQQSPTPLEPGQRERYVGGDHFYTTWEWERDNAIQNLGHTYEGIACWVYSLNNPQPNNTIPIHRWQGRYTPCGDHFYAATEADRRYAVDLGYEYEGLAFYAFSLSGPPTAYPMQRLINRTTGDHFYTASQAEAIYAHQNLGYSYDGSNFRVWTRDHTGEPPYSNRTVPLYRTVSR